MNAIDLLGQQCGRWTVLSRGENSAQGQARWLCRCECGTERLLASVSIRSGHSRSCGCLKRETTIRLSTTHGHATNGITPTYHTWAGMTARCGDLRHTSFATYGGRGISVCSRWEHFANFLADMGEKPSGMSLDRIDSDGNYEPTNCRWATPTEQARNKRNNRRLTLNGETHCVAEWAEIIGIRPASLDDRLRNGWSVERALTTQSSALRQNCQSRV